MTIRKSLYSLLLIPSFISSMEKEERPLHIKPTSLFSRTVVGDFDLCYQNGNFTVLQDSDKISISKHFIDPLLKKINRKQLKKFQKIGYLEVKKNAFNEFSLISKVRGNGGGMVTASIFYWATKSLLYGTGVAAVGAGIGATATAVVASGGAVGGAIGAGMAGAAYGGGAAIAGGAIATTTLGTAIATVPVAAVAGGIAASTTTLGAATVVTGGAIAASGGCIFTLMAGIEAASLAAGAAGAALWFLP